MTLLTTIWSGFVGLFVDDLPYAGAILAWLAACKVLLPHVPLPESAPPLLLFVGLAAILAVGAWFKKSKIA